MTPHEIMSQNFKQWAFSAILDGVVVYNRANVSRARKILADCGFNNVCVTYKNPLKLWRSSLAR